jgi:hypothetical protein
MGYQRKVKEEVTSPRDILERLTEECHELDQAAIEAIRSMDRIIEDTITLNALRGKVPEAKWEVWANRIANRYVTAKNETGGDT